MAPLVDRARAIFFGTPEIAVPALRALATLAEVTAVVCQPDRPAGRGLKLKAPPVKEAAEALGLDVTQPTRIKNEAFARWVGEQSADVAVVIAYGRILPPSVLAAPRCGCVNLHASLLPKYRGAAPINWAIVEGERETGVSLMQMDVGMDTGPVYSRHRVPIGPDETAGELYARLGALAAEVVLADLPRLLRGELAATPQDDREASHAPMLKRDDGRIDWSQPAARVHDRVRGLTPWPGAHTLLGDKRFKVLSTARSDEEVHAAPGTVVRIDEDAIVACGGGSALRLVRGQLEGKRPMLARELENGRQLKAAMRLG